MINNNKHYCLMPNIMFLDVTRRAELGSLIASVGGNGKSDLIGTER